MLVAYSIEIITVHMYITDPVQDRTVFMLVADSIGQRTVLMFFADYIEKHQPPIFNQAARKACLKKLQLNTDLAQV
jgi:hypothetical protein